MKQSKRSKLSVILLPLLASLSVACVEHSEDGASLRILPVTAITADGGEVLVGTYDEGLGELVLTPTFVAAIEGEVLSGSELELRGPGQVIALGSRSVWDEPFEVGTELMIAAEYGGEGFVGGTLVVEDAGWTDSLTEAEAASSFPKCWDPLPDVPDTPQQV